VIVLRLRTLLVAALTVAVGAGLLWLRSPTSPLEAIVRGGDGPPTVVLLHGYGGRADQWLQLVPMFQFPGSTRMVFPQAPLRVLQTAPRGWWRLDIEGNIPPGQRFPDFSDQDPDGIRVAAQLVLDLVRDVEGPLIIGGFSQGAMVSAEIAFNTDHDLAGLILLGGTPVHEETWAAHFAGRRLLPVFIAHGRGDDVLSFAQMERFQARVKASGMDVTWLPFEGEHDIPREVVRGMNVFISRVVGLQSSLGRP